MSLVQNIKFQLASVATLFFVMGCWIFIFAHKGFHQDIPAFGNDQGSLIGFVLNNFAFVSSTSPLITGLPLTFARLPPYHPSSTNYPDPSQFTRPLPTLFLFALLYTSSLELRALLVSRSSNHQIF
jgi:hypothetical protein